MNLRTALFLLLFAPLAGAQGNTPEADAETSPPTGERTEKKAANDTRRFVPTEEISPDQEVDFPADI